MSRDKFRKYLVDHLSQSGVVNSDETPVTEQSIFGNWPGVRLSEHGNSLLRTTFTQYKFQIPDETVISVVGFTKLNRKMISPYYLYTHIPSKKRILILYSQDDYVHLQLMDDFGLWLDSL